jgi:hypothetical protein
MLPNPKLIMTSQVPALGAAVAANADARRRCEAKTREIGCFGCFWEMILIDLELTISYLIKYGSSDMLIFKIWNRMRSLENSLDDFGGEICKGHSKFPKKNMSWGSSLKIPEVRQNPQGKPVSFRQELP